jgi:hypothetical protein
MLSKKILLASLLGLAWACLGSAVGKCPLLGFDLVPPRAPSSSATIQDAKENVTAVFEQLLNAGVDGVNGTPFSVQVYSTHAKDPFFQYHHSAPVGRLGAQHVDENSIGSVTKLLTVYLWLILDTLFSLLHCSECGMSLVLIRSFLIQNSN